MHEQCISIHFFDFFNQCLFSAYKMYRVCWILFHYLLRMSWFTLHSWRIYWLNVEFLADNSFLSYLKNIVPDSSFLSYLKNVWFPSGLQSFSWEIIAIEVVFLIVNISFLLLFSRVVLFCFFPSIVFRS